MDIISTASEMSNLVGMSALIIEDGKIKARIFIKGKANNEYFICQNISPLDGSLNVSKLVKLEEMRSWIIIENTDLFNEIISDYYKNGWRYDVNF